MYRKYFFILASLFSLSTVAQNLGQVMTAFPAGEYHGKVTSISADGQPGDSSTLMIASKGDNLLNIGIEGPNADGVGLLVLKFQPDGQCIEDRGKNFPEALLLRGTCIDNTIKLRQEFQNGSSGYEIREVQYVWDGNVVHYSQKSWRKKSKDDQDTNPEMTSGDLVKVGSVQ